MDPKADLTDSERILRAEIEIRNIIQEMESSNAAMCQDIDEVRQEVRAVSMDGKETREMVMGMKAEMAAMPGAIVRAMKEEGKGKRMEVKEWLLVLMAALVLLVSLPASCQSVQSLSKQVVATRSAQ